MAIRVRSCGGANALMRTQSSNIHKIGPPIPNAYILWDEHFTGLLSAVEEFLAISPDWHLQCASENNKGLTILARHAFRLSEELAAVVVAANATAGFLRSSDFMG